MDQKPLPDEGSAPLKTGGKAAAETEAAEKAPVKRRPRVQRGPRAGAKTKGAVEPPAAGEVQAQPVPAVEPPRERTEPPRERVQEHEPEPPPAQEQPAAATKAEPADQRERREPQPQRDEREGGQQHHRQAGQQQRQHGGHEQRFGDSGFKKGKRNKRGRNKPHRENRSWQAKPSQPPPPTGVVVSGELPQASRFADLAALDSLAAEIGAGGEPIYLDELYALGLQELAARARELGVTLAVAPNPRQLMADILQLAHERKLPIMDRGLLDLTDRGYGFVVHGRDNYRYNPESSYVPESLVKRFGLKRGHAIEVQVQSPLSGERCPAALRIINVMGRDPEEVVRTVPFEELVPYYPLKRILLEVADKEGGSKDVSMRAVDILTPIGFGQRGLIVAPPRTGKTVLLQSIANSVARNFPDSKLIVLLIDERPEEVTDFRRHTLGEVVSSTFDETPESHVHAAEMVGEKARRLVEMGEHVVILLDSITRLARAYNALASSSGKIMSGGMEATALQRPKRFFGAARNIEGAGSLTIMATALVDTGSRMDEVIFEEFKGTGNMELHLDRGLVDKRIFPAINMERSGTRKEELIYHPDEMNRIYALRRAMQGVPPLEAMEMLIQRLRKTKSNAEFLMGLNR